MNKINSKTENVVTGSDNLSEIVRILSKEVKQEEDNLYRVLLCGLSAFTAEPINLRILAPSSEGKSYMIEKVSKLFPPENMIKLASASSKSFQYAHGKKVVDENGEEINPKEIEELQKKLAETNDKEERKKIRKEIKAKKNEYTKNSWNLVDLSQKWLIFLDSQDAGLWMSLKSLLSHDSENIKHQMTNKKSGTNAIQRVIFKGKPAVTYASARDEKRWDSTGEIESRFQTISLVSNPEKYRKSIELLSKNHGLGPFYEEEIFGDHDLNKAKELVSKLIENVAEYGKKKYPVIDPFIAELSARFPHTDGIKSREFARLAQTITIVTLCNSDKRAKIVKDEAKYPVVYLEDIKRAVKLMQGNLGLPSHKIQFFNQNIKPAIRERGNEVAVDSENVVAATASEITEYYTEQTHERNTDRKKILETYLTPLCQYGFLESKEDPRNKSRSIFWISPSYENRDAETESTLIDVSTMDHSCVESYLNEYLKRRIEKGMITVIDSNDTEIQLEELNKLVVGTTLNDSVQLQN